MKSIWISRAFSTSGITNLSLLYVDDRPFYTKYTKWHYIFEVFSWAQTETPEKSNWWMEISAQLSNRFKKKTPFARNGVFNYVFTFSYQLNLNKTCCKTYMYITITNHDWIVEKKIVGLKLQKKISITRGSKIFFFQGGWCFERYRLLKDVEGIFPAICFC